jgi:hypothetical protein
MQIEHGKIKEKKRQKNRQKTPTTPTLNSIKERQ